MKKVIVVFGFGPGISSAVARKFGAEGFSVALVARDAERLARGVATLQAEGLDVAGFCADAGQPAQVTRVLDEVRNQFGAITVLQWTAYSGLAGNVLETSPEELSRLFDVPIVGLVSAIQNALPDLEQAEKPAVLVTNGGFGLFHDGSDEAGARFHAMGLSIANSAKHKLVRLLHLALAPRGVFVGDVVVLSTVRGTAFDDGSAPLEASRVAEAFWELYTKRSERTVTIS